MAKAKKKKVVDPQIQIREAQDASRSQVIKDSAAKYKKSLKK
jgi:hypothetical protein